MNYNFIVIEGNIGAGKTSLVKKIARQYNAKLILEQFENNPFLPKFYENPDKYSFPLELSFLAERYNQLKNELSNRDLFKTFTIADYYFMKCLIFSKLTLANDEYNLFRQLFNIIYRSLPEPDLYVFLHLNIDALIDNIKRRGRNYEKEIDRKYLEKIQKGYYDFFMQQQDLRILIIDVNNIDFVNNDEHYKLLVEAIFNPDVSRYKKGINQAIIQKNLLNIK